ncbi:hypothetical protein [Rhizorhabdus phycosphaerae]|uniref:hypothetical protein n=1 Tax=Rhizorhabdus phycosphaerae TaxID=2711156 RepID=UPI0019CFB4D4|nr:hypothetical protein [Rhizorhabdus phycosphaerae]
MTSISGSMSRMSMPSMNDILKSKLQSAVTAGTVKAEDQTALSSALDDIDSVMKSSGPPKPGMDPSAIKEKVSGLIDQEVADGKLTEEQAAELREFLDNAARNGPAGGQVADASGEQDGEAFAIDGMSGPRGPGGPPPPPPANEETSDDSTTSLADAREDAVEALMTFLEQLSKSTAENSVYTSGGTSSGSNYSSLLVDKTA